MSRTQNRFGDRLLMALVFLFLYAPIIILIVFSFNAGTSSSVWKGFSLKWYESLLSNRLIMNSVYTTLLVSLLSTYRRHLRRHRPVRHEPPPSCGGERRQQHPHDECGYRHRR